jgi:adenosylhomocysteine nucleosidase
VQAIGQNLRMSAATLTNTNTNTNTNIKTAILSALLQEQQGLIELLEQPRMMAHAGREFWQGTLYGEPVVLALSRIGKVAAATTATALIERFGVKQMVFTGVAGGLGANVKVGDVVVAADFLQHDLDVSPLFPRYQVPLYGKARFVADQRLSALLVEAAGIALGSGLAQCADLEYPGARVHHGLIASGDRFVSGAQECRLLIELLAAAGHPALAVEMEGAAVAQVCHDYGIAFAAVRTISDRADESAHVDFHDFVQHTASLYTRDIIKNFLRLL